MWEMVCRRGGKWGEGGERICPDQCPVTSHIRGAGGQANSKHCSPPSNLCLSNQKHMAPYNDSTVVP